MRFLNAAVAASVVAVTYLVFELWSKGAHYGSFLIEPNHRQYYDIPRTDVRPHFQLISTQVHAYIGTLTSQSFEEVEDATRTSLRHSVRPKKFYTVLKSCRNYYLNEVTVVNLFRHGSKLREHADKIPMTKLAQRMFVDEYEGLCGDVRGNLRYDIGYTAVNQTDASIVKGMFFPKRLVPCSKKSGMEDDLTMEHSLFRYGCYVKMMADEIQDNPDNRGVTYFDNEERDNWFGHRWAEALLLGPLKPWACFDGLSCFGTGGTIDHRVIKTDVHVDRHNSKVRGEDHCPTYTEWVWVVTPSGYRQQVRVGINLYKKACCDDAMRRLSVNQSIAELLDERLGEDDGTKDSKPLHKKFVPPREGGTLLDNWVYPADDDKDGHYSMYVNVLNEIGDRYGRNRAVLIEALLTIPFTPASDGWYHNMMSVLEEMEIGNEEQGLNLMECYIELANENHGSVSWGDYYRCQTSHRGKVTKRQLFQSAQNLDHILDLAECTHNTKGIVKKLASSAKKGGVHGVGQFYAQVLINIATKIGLLKNKSHLGQVAISTTTATYTRLKKLGVRSKNHAAEIVPYLCGKLEETPHVCENMVCELLRRMYGRDGTKDYFVKGHKLFVVRDDKVCTIGTGGTATEVEYIKETYNNLYNPSVYWWNASVVSFGNGPHDWDQNVISLKKRKFM
jgi:hypothetical protein